MASFSGFVRKSPDTRFRHFLNARGIEAPDDFNWIVIGRGTAFVRSIEELIAAAPDLLQDKIKAELDLLASLSDATGMQAAEQVCLPYGVDIEGLEGVEDTLLMVATDHPGLIDRIDAQASLMRRTGGRDWAAYELDGDSSHWALDDPDARRAFLEDAMDILQLPSHRKREADWYQATRTDPATGDTTDILQATLYVEERAISALSFGDGATLERTINKRVLEVGVACDAQNKVIEICAKGGVKTRDQYAAAFAKRFAPTSSTPVQTPRRDVNLHLLRTAPNLWTQPSDGIERIEVSALDFRSSDGGFAHFERRGDGETVYAFLDRSFGPSAPTKAPGWAVLGATLRIKQSATDQRKKRTLTVTLRSPNTTTLPNKADADRRLVFGLLERWGILAPGEDNFDVLEAS